MLAILTVTIPDADALPMPAPPWLLLGLLMLTFSLHVLAMNFVLGGSILMAVARFRRGTEATALIASFGKAMPSAVAAAISLGVAPLLFLQALYGRLFFTSTVLMGWIWLAVIPLVMLAYYGTYAIAFGSQAKKVLGVMIALVFAGIAFIYANNMSLMLRPQRFLPMYTDSGRGLHLNLADPTLLPRYLHMLAGAIAVAGMCVAIFGAFRRDRWATRYGAGWFAAATLANLATGVWWLGSLPRPVIMASSVAVGLGAVAGFAAVGVIHMGHLKTAAALLVASIVAMVVARDQVREGMLGIAGFTSTPRIEPQWDVIAIFAVLLVAALATTAWMIAISVRAEQPQP